ncbi:MAG: amidase [Burkholderiaceae bacterium]
MAILPPTPAQLHRIADRLGLSLTDADAASFIALAQPQIDSYNLVAAMPDELPSVAYPRTPGVRPPVEDNPQNAWYVKSTVRGAADGRLAGRSVVLKDNIMLAGVPMMNGSSTLDGYVPNVDATLVTRILDAGGTIVGKAHCENFCMSGGSHTGSFGPVHNPHKHGWSAGGSSSGCAVLVAKGEVDMAIGGDQGGSIRMPASFCGIYGMKPTHGLVPYTGVMPIEVTVDHVGPMTATVADNALLLEVIAGVDGYDARQYDVPAHDPDTRRYSEGLGRDIAGLRIGVVREGFLQANAEKAVNDKVMAAAARLRELGALVEEVAIPMHLLGPSIAAPILIEGSTQTMMAGDGYGTSRKDLYVTSLMDFHRHWRERADELSETTKLFLLLGEFVRERHGSRFYGKSINLARRLRAAYDAQLARYDLLMMPTTAVKATKLPDPGAPREEIVARAFDMTSNTGPFDITHHPAMAIPCGIADGLPVSMMLIGRHFDEATIYRAAHAYEQSHDWRTC